MGGLRVILCGAVVGGFWSALSVPVVAFLGQDFIQHLPQGLGTAGDGIAPHVIFLLANLVSGVCAMTIYRLARMRPMSRDHAVSLAAVLWWLFSQQETVKWLLLMGIPMSDVVPISATSLPAMALSLWLGGRMLDRATGDLEPKPANPSQPSAAR